MQRVDLLDLRRTECIDVIVAVGKSQDALLHVFGRHQALHRCCAGVDTALVVEEIEDTVFLYRSAERRAKLIAVESRDGTPSRSLNQLLAAVMVLRLYS